MIKEFSGDLLQWLRGFYFIATSGSLSAAAKRMHRTQSTLSYQLQCLEKELNVRLFHRVNNKLQITKEGNLLLGKAISTFESINSMWTDLVQDDNELKGFLTIDCTRPLALSILTTPTVEFCRAHPLVKLKISVLPPSSIISNVENANVDFGLLGLNFPVPTCHLDKLFVSKAVLVTPAEHRYMLSPTPTPEQLVGLPLIVRVQEYIDQATAPTYSIHQLEFLNMKIVAEVSLPQLILELVAQGFGVAVMDEFSVWVNANAGLNVQLYDLSEHLPSTTYGFLIRHQKYLSPQAEKIMASIKEKTTTLVQNGQYTPEGTPVFRYTQPKPCP